MFGEYMIIMDQGNQQVLRQEISIKIYEITDTKIHI